MGVLKLKTGGVYVDISNIVGDHNYLDGLQGGSASEYYHESLARYNLLVAWGPETSRTINISTADTDAQIQAKIDAAGKHIPYGVTLTFQYADGTYTQTAVHTYAGFWGLGTLVITGKASESTLSTSKSVILDSSASGGIKGIYVSCCTCNITLACMEIKINSNTGYGRCVWADHLQGDVQIKGLYCLGNGKGIGCWLMYINYGGGTVWCYNNYFENATYGLGGKLVAFLYSDNNDDNGTAPTWGLYAEIGTTIVKNGTQPAGTTANELTATGGLIR